MTIGIYGRLIHQEDAAFIKHLCDYLSLKKINVVVHQPYLNEIKKYVDAKINHPTFLTHDDINGKIDCLISLGGDGTLLDTIGLIKDSGIGVLGINAGRLGFLATVSKNEIEQAVDSIVNQEFKFDKRSLLKFESNSALFGENNFALNEFTLHKKATSSMIIIHTYLNGEFLTSYWADGLIVSTPTGSTAYNLSCGGPILVPSSENFVITPVAPHNLNVRPLVIPDSSILTFEIEGRSDAFLCTLDSRQETIDASAQMAVKKADWSLNLIRLNDANFLDTIRTKLNWGKDQRN
jgi:NAD+ kinase